MKYYNDAPIAQVKALETAIDIHTAGYENAIYRKWATEARDNLRFADGFGQWSDRVVAELNERGISPVVVNKTKALLNQISGQEMAGRYKTGYGSHSFNEQSTEIAKALTHLGYYYQDNLFYLQKSSLMTKDSANVGLGWSNNYRSDNKIFYERVHPLFVVFDALDISEQLTNMSFVSHLFPLSVQEIKNLWPHKARRIEDGAPLSSNDWRVGDIISELEMANSMSSRISGGASIAQKPFVIALQHKVNKKYFTGIDQAGNRFNTFNEEEAEKIAADKKEIEEKRGTQILRTVYWRDILLDYAPLDPNIPNLENFTLIPQVWSRRWSDFGFSNVVEDVRDLQIELNYRKQKSLTSIDSFRVSAEEDAFPNLTTDEVAKLYSRPDAVVLYAKGSKVDVIPNTDLAAAHINAQNRNDLEFEQVSGVYRESYGEETNANSGVAIKARQAGSSRNLSSAFDSIKIRKTREARMLLDLIQTSTDRNILVEFLDEDEQKSILLNVEREINGKKYMFNDIRSFPVSIYVKQTPDFNSSPEEIAAKLEDILNNPNAESILQNTELMKLLQLPGYKKIAAATKQAMQERMSMQQGAMPNPEQQVGQGGDMDMDTPHQ